MSLQDLTGQAQSRLDATKDELRCALEAIAPKNLTSLLRFTARFKVRHSTNEIGLDKFTTAQLHAKSDRVQANLDHVSRLKAISTYMSECQTLLKKNNISDYKQAHSHLNTIDASISRYTSLVIYDNLRRWVTSTRTELASAMNTGLKLVVPNPYTISNISQLHDLISFAHEINVELDGMKTLRLEWELLVAQALAQPQDELVFDDSELIDDCVAIVKRANSGRSMFQSVHAFVEFINHIGIGSVKNYLSGRISALLTEKISANIDTMIGDSPSMKDLKQLIELCSLTEWNVLKQLRGGLMQTNLNTMHENWQVCNYIDKARALIRTDLMKSHFQWSPPIPETNAKTTSTDDWDNGWDDEWDVEMNDDETHANPQNEGPLILVSNLAREAAELIREYKQKTNQTSPKLEQAVVALMATVYTGTENPFALLNDFQYINTITGSDSYTSSATAFWNQCLVRYYHELKVVLFSFNLNATSSQNEDEGDGDEDDLDGFDDGFDAWGDEEEQGKDITSVELSDYNINQLSLLHEWFKRLFGESKMIKFNATKFENFALDMIDFVNKCFLDLVVALEDITGNQLKQITAMVDSLNNVTVPFVIQLKKTKDDVKSYHQLQNLQFLLNSPLRHIMDKFYEGDLFDIDTDTLVKLIKGIFIESELRTNCLEEIIEFRDAE